MIAMLITVFGACLLVERFRPGWKQPNRSQWEYRVLFLAAFELCVVLLIGAVVKDWWQLPSVFDWSTYPPVAGGLMAYLAASFVFYWWHRARHECAFLWRIFHQLHHSPGRLETLTAFYKHPLEAATNSLLSATLVYFVGSSRNRVGKMSDKNAGTPHGYWLAGVSRCA